MNNMNSNLKKSKSEKTYLLITKRQKNRILDKFVIKIFAIKKFSIVP